MIEELLPGYNCGKCGCRDCEEFSTRLKADKNAEDCPFLIQERYESNLKDIKNYLESNKTNESIIGVIDNLHASFALSPLPHEQSCREDLFPMDREVKLHVGDVIQYRPLGCPITHFAKILKVSHGIITVHLIGPRNLLGDLSFSPQDIGICMVAAFEGTVSRGRIPRVCESVKFLPEHCMMGKIHSGIVVSVEGKKVRIEGIDLKVW